MDFKGLKKYIHKENKIETVLQALGCKNLVKHQKYIACSNPDGDNPSAIQVYIEEGVKCHNYTRNINDGRQIDIINLANYFRGESVAKTFLWMSQLVGFSKVDEDVIQTNEEFKDFLDILEETEKIVDSTYVTENPILSESILNSCVNKPNILFFRDNIKYDTQMLFEVGIDKASERISIPIRNPQGQLVGVKGRYFGAVPNGINKYIALHNYQKSLVLYGLHLTLDEIIKQNKVYVFESEKSVMQSWEYGIKNCVAIGGHNLSETQIMDLEGLGVDIILCFDKDIDMVEICNITRKTFFQKVKLRFRDDVNVGYMQDTQRVLGEKESFSDRMSEWHTFTEIIGG